jgi:hypothetical protein
MLKEHISKDSIKDILHYYRLTNNNEDDEMLSISKTQERKQ